MHPIVDAQCTRPHAIPRLLSQLLVVAGAGTVLPARRYPDPGCTVEELEVLQVRIACGLRRHQQHVWLHMVRYWGSIAMVIVGAGSHETRPAFCVFCKLCRFVEDEGEILFYKTADDLNKGLREKKGKKSQ